MFNIHLYSYEQPKIKTQRLFVDFTETFEGHFYIIYLLIYWLYDIFIGLCNVNTPYMLFLSV